MLRSGLARVANQTSLVSKLMSASPLTTVMRGKHRTQFLTPKDAIELNGAPEAFPTPAHVVPFEYTAMTLSVNNTVMHVAPQTPVQKKMELTAAGEKRFFYSLANPSKPYVIKAQVRDSWSNDSNERNRMELGRIPCVINSPSRNSEPLNIFVDPVDLQVLREYRNLENSIYHLEVEGFGERFRCLVRDFVEDSVTSKVIHVSFMTMEPGRSHAIKVPVVVEGGADALAVKRGAILLQPIGHITAFYNHTLACKLGVGAPPRSVHVNVVDCGIGDTIHTYDIALPPFMHVDDRRAEAGHVLVTFKKI